MNASRGLHDTMITCGRMHGKCCLDNSSLKTLDASAKYLNKYTDTFDVLDSVVRQFLIKILGSN